MEDLVGVLIVICNWFTACAVISLMIIGIAILI